MNDISSAVTTELTNLFPVGTIVNNIDGISLIQKKKNKEIFIFLDPPYHHSTRVNNTEIYQYELQHSDHIKLLSTILESKNNIMIIHPKCELYDTMLKDWRKVEIKIRYHQKTSIEYLYMNYPSDLPLQTYHYFGSDCWDRQRIKRKSDRMVKKFETMPVAEKQYILAQLKVKKII